MVPDDDDSDDEDEDSEDADDQLVGDMSDSDDDEEQDLEKLMQSSLQKKAKTQASPSGGILKKPQQQSQ